MRLAKEEAAGVTIHGRKEAALKEVKEKVTKAGKATKVHVVVGDISNDDVRQKLVNETVQQFGKLDVLVSFDFQVRGVFEPASIAFCR